MKEYLPSFLSSDSKDLTHEERVKRDCDHSWRQSTEETDELYGEPRIERGHLIVQVAERVETFCVKCGKEREYDYVPAPGRDEFQLYQGGKKYAIPASFEMDADVSIEEVITDSDEPDNGNGRVIINRSENPTEIEQSD